MLRPWSSFDWLFIIWKNDKSFTAGSGRMIPKDDLPEPWLNPETYDEADLPWLSKQKGWRISWNNHKELAKEIERVMTTAIAQGRYHAKRSVQIDSTLDFDVRFPKFTEIAHEQIQDGDKQDAYIGDQHWRGSRRRWSRKQFEAVHQSTLEKQLRDR